MSARSKARKQTLDLLYEADIRGAAAIDILAGRVDNGEDLDARPIREFTRELIVGISAQKRKIDELISTYAKGWDMDRLPTVDRNILRLAIYELVWSPDLAEGIVINEALDLAKELSTDESASYIHGVLGKISMIKESIAR